MDLGRPVRLQGEPWDGAAYRTRLESEQSGSCAWLGRVARGEEPLDWSVPASLEAKVDASGAFRPFAGDTVVFPLDAEGAERCAELREGLTRGLEDLFAHPLDPREFHLTLHDLSNGAPTPALEGECRANEEACRGLFRQIRSVLEEHPDLAGIPMHPVRLFDCLNISVLLGLAPASEPDFRALLNLYGLFDPIRTLGYWLRPHVTLAYFRPRVPTPGEVRELSRRLETLGPLPELRLSTWDLAYQRFEDMNRYQTRFTVREA